MKEIRHFLAACRSCGQEMFVTTLGSTAPTDQQDYIVRFAVDPVAPRCALCGGRLLPVRDLSSVALLPATATATADGSDTKTHVLRNL